MLLVSQTLHVYTNTYFSPEDNVAPGTSAYDNVAPGTSAPDISAYDISLGATAEEEAEAGTEFAVVGDEEAAELELVLVLLLVLWALFLSPLLAAVDK